MNKLNNIAVIIRHWESNPRGYAKFLLREHHLPHSLGYAFTCSASSWLSLQGKEAKARKQYEAGAWEELKLNELVGSSGSAVVGVVGLAVGEGLGEIELLRKMLNEGYTVHYLAVDLSPVLLTAHIETVRETLHQQLCEGRLICAGLTGDVFDDLPELVSMARGEFQRRGVIKHAEEFLPKGSPLMATYLGTCLGNDAPGREKLIFSTVAQTFTAHRPLLIVVGVSVMRPQPDTYSHSFSSFLLQTPLHIHKDLDILRSGKPPSSNEPDEFEVPADGRAGERLLPVRPCDYSSPQGVEGQIYKFHYRLAFDLDVPGTGLCAPAGTDILLYSITKYNPETLRNFLEREGYAVRYDPGYHLCIETEFGVREYVVFAATLPD